MRENLCFLFNVDQVYNFDVQTVHFFRENKDYSPEIVAEMLRNALVRAMDVYEFLAGRIRVNRSSGSLDVDCNGAGAGFVMAESEYSLEELGDLVYPNPSCAKLVTSQLQSLPKDDQPLFAFQVTNDYFLKLFQIIMYFFLWSNKSPKKNILQVEYTLLYNKNTNKLPQNL